MRTMPGREADYAKVAPYLVVKGHPFRIEYAENTPEDIKKLHQELIKDAEITKRRLMAG